jgi:hypothetical protein
VTAALRGVDERPFDARVTVGMGRVVREIDGMRAVLRIGEFASRILKIWLGFLDAI